MTSTPEADTSINTFDLGVRLGRLEAGQEALKDSLGEVKATLGKVRNSLAFLLLAWVAMAAVALLVVAPMALTLAKP